MTIYYVASDGNNTTGLSWANAFTTIGDEFTYASGDVVYVDKTFQETITATAPGANANGELPVRFYSVDRTGNPEPPDETDYSPQTTQYILQDTSSSFVLSAGAVWHGFYFKSTGTGYFINPTEGLTFIDCIFEHPIDEKCNISPGERGTMLINCTMLSDGTSGDDAFLVNHTGSAFGKPVEWIGCDFSDTTLAYRSSIIGGTSNIKVVFKGCDFSSYGTSAAGVQLATSTACDVYAVFISCKLPTNSFSYTSVSGTSRGRYELLGCDDGSDQETDTIRAFNGELDTWGAGIASRAVYRTAGFTRKDQSNAQCWRIDSTTRMDYGTPLQLFPISVYNDTTGSTRKITVEYLLGDASATDDLAYTEMWLEVGYYDDAGPLLTIEDNRESPDLEATPTAHATSTEAWTTTDAEANTAKRKMEITTSGTVAQEGFITVNVYVASIGTNDSVYIDPLATVGAA